MIHTVQIMIYMKPGIEMKQAQKAYSTNTECGNIFGGNNLPSYLSPTLLVLSTVQVNGAGQLLYILYTILTIGQQ